MKENSIVVGEGRYKVELKATFTGNGVIIHLLGGEKPHVGGVATSVPRPKTNGEGITVDTWISPVPGHKDSFIAQPVAEKLCRYANEVVTVVAGVHIKKASKEEIELLTNNCLRAAELLIELIEVENA